MNFPSMSQINILLNIFDKIRNYCIWIFKSKPKFKKSPYYFKKYHKHATVYDNGNGIIIISFDITFNNKDVNRLVRGVNISDGKLSAVFQSLENMKELSLKERFDKCGF